MSRSCGSQPRACPAIAAASANDLGSASSVPSASTVFGKSQARATSTGYVTVAAQAATAPNAGTVVATGGSQAHNNMAPYLALNFCIALQGIFPPRS